MSHSKEHVLGHLWSFIYTCVLPSFEYRFNSVLFVSVTAICSKIPCSSFGICGNQEFDFYCDEWLLHDAGSRCGESQNRFQTLLFALTTDAFSGAVFFTISFQRFGKILCGKPFSLLFVLVLTLLVWGFFPSILRVRLSLSFLIIIIFITNNII